MHIKVFIYLWRLSWTNILYPMERVRKMISTFQKWWTCCKIGRFSCVITTRKCLKMLNKVDCLFCKTSVYVQKFLVSIYYRWCYKTNSRFRFFYIKNHRIVDFNDTSIRISNNNSYSGFFTIISFSTQSVIRITFSDFRVITQQKCS